MTFLIIDGYVDEPTCLGVPPYFSTYSRYSAGAAVCAGIEKKNIEYLTIESIRKTNYILDSRVSLSAIVSGNPVPGKYLGGIPANPSEIDLITRKNPGIKFIIGGPFFSSGGKCGSPNTRVIANDLEASIYDLIRSAKITDRKMTGIELEKFSLSGAFIVVQHPRYPDIIMEIETGSGCPRATHCTFCIEGCKDVSFRKPEEIISEIESLYNEGVRHFRLGKQADLFSFGSLMSTWRNGFPKPEPEKIKELYCGIRDLMPEIKTLHLDNVNPGTIANFQEESLEIAGIIASNNTPGDVAALGMESADPAVIVRNRLKAMPGEVKTAVEIINSAGSRRVEGIAKLLPGVNIIKGLPGENRETFRLNYEFLLSLLESSLLLRRINIRQLKLPSGDLSPDDYRIGAKEGKKLDAIFRNYRYKIMNEIDNPMLKKIYPGGTLLKDLIVETARGDWVIARQLGTYPVAVNIPKILPVHSKLNAFVISSRERSLVGLPAPLDRRQVSAAELRQIPGISKLAGKLFSIPGWAKEELSVSPIYEKIKNYIE